MNVKKSSHIAFEEIGGPVFAYLNTKVAQTLPEISNPKSYQHEFEVVSAPDWVSFDKKTKLFTFEPSEEV